MRSLLLLAGLGLCSGCTPVADTPIPVSFAELRNHPERYAGQEVVLEAYIDLCWEGGWLSETESDWQSSDGKQDIQVQPSTHIDADSYDGTFGRVYGLVLSNREPWHPILGVTHVLPLWRFRERSEPTEFTGTTEELLEGFLELHPELTGTTEELLELYPELRLLMSTESAFGPPLPPGE